MDSIFIKVVLDALSRVRNFFIMLRICTAPDFKQLAEMCAIYLCVWNGGAVVPFFKNLYTALSDYIPV